MAKIGLLNGSGKRSKVGEKSVKSQGILKWILSMLSGNRVSTELKIDFWNENLKNIVWNHNA